MVIRKCISGFKTRLAEVIGKESISSFSKRCEMSETVIRDYLSGKTYPSLNRLATIAEKCNVSYCWLATGNRLDDLEVQGNGEIFHEPIHRIPVYYRQQASYEEAVQQKLVRGTPPTMSYPALNGWLGFRGLDPKQLIFYWAKGDLMEPEIKHNDGVMLTTDEDDVIEGQIYLFEYEDINLLRRVRFCLEGWTLLSNKKDSEPIIVKRDQFDKYKIVGRVVQIIKDVF